MTKNRITIFEFVIYKTYTIRNFSKQTKLNHTKPQQKLNPETAPKTNTATIKISTAATGEAESTEKPPMYFFFVYIMVHRSSRVDERRDVTNCHKAGGLRAAALCAPIRRPAHPWG